MLERVKSYFRHYRSERRGLIVFAVVLFLLIVGIEVFRLVYEPKVKRIDILLVDHAEPKDVHGYETSSTEQEINLFPFNPNTLPDSGFSALGFSEKEIKTLRNYQKAGASFEIKRDFAKLFFVDEEEYNKLEPFIDLPEVKAKKEYVQSFEKKASEPQVRWSDTASTEKYKFEKFRCNINTADTNELKRLHGIGSFYANKIVERRNELGGYHNLAQLLELWNMTSETIDKFADQIIIDPSDIRQIEINRVSAYELSQHPYVSFGNANKIVLNREQSGTYPNSKAFCSSGLLDADLCRKLVPYLNFTE